jgi:hypothetical protein
VKGNDHDDDDDDDNSLKTVWRAHNIELSLVFCPKLNSNILLSALCSLLTSTSYCRHFGQSDSFKFCTNFCVCEATDDVVPLKHILPGISTDLILSSWLMLLRIWWLLWMGWNVAWLLWLGSCQCNDIDLHCKLWDKEVVLQNSLNTSRSIYDDVESFLPCVLPLVSAYSMYGYGYDLGSVLILYFYWLLVFGLRHFLSILTLTSLVKTRWYLSKKYSHGKYLSIQSRSRSHPIAGS